MLLEMFLQEYNIDYEKHVHRATFTAQGLAATEHVSGYEVAKPVVVWGEHGFAMCVLPACAHLDLAKAAALLGDTRLRLASELEMAELFGDCELGAEPPFGSAYGMKMVMDESLGDDEYLTMQAGRHTEAIKLRREDWERVCTPIVGQIAMR